MTKFYLVVCCNAKKCGCKGCSHRKPHTPERSPSGSSCENVDECGETGEDVYCEKIPGELKDPNILFQLQRRKRGKRS